MKKLHTQQNNEFHHEKLAHVHEELSRPPNQKEVAHSFNTMMQSVTDEASARIPTHTEEDVPKLSISTHIMSHMTKVLSVSVVAAVFVLVIGYTAYTRNNVSEYDDVISAALGDDAPYLVALGEDDDFSDLAVDDIGGDDTLLAMNTNAEKRTPSVTLTPEPEAPTVVTPTNTPPPTETIEETLTALDDIFSDDDIDDAELNAWFEDTSSSDDLTQTYEF